jgi:hypothetical protein
MSDLNMKSIAFGTAGLAMVLIGPAGAIAPGAAINPSINLPNNTPAISLAPAKSDSNRATHDSFPSVNNSERDVTRVASDDSSVTRNAGNQLAESSGSPAETSDVPMPGAGWISFFGVAGVIAARQYSLSRRRTGKTVWN